MMALRVSRPLAHQFARVPGLRRIAQLTHNSPRICMSAAAKELHNELVVVALGGNALLRRGEPLTADAQRRNATAAATAIAKVHAAGPRMVLVHGNGPQVGLLAVNDPETSLDVLDAESEGEIGFILELALANALPPDQHCAALLTQVVVDPGDPAFKAPSKPIGRWYDDDHMGKDRGWAMAKDGDRYRRVVPSPQPRAIIEAHAIQALLDAGVLVICCGGGGIPVAMNADTRERRGIEAVVDKDAASALLAASLGARWLLILTDEDAVYDPTVWPQERRPLPSPITPAQLQEYAFPAGSMGPKVEAAIRFVQDTGGTAGIGNMEDALEIVRGKAGTLVKAKS